MEHFSKKKTKMIFEKHPRIGDHKWWISDVRKFQNHFPGWKINYSIEKIIEDMFKSSKSNSK